MTTTSEEDEMANEQADTQEPETEYPLPAGYENQSVGFARAYAHAKRHGNEDKASLLYAESWQHDFEETEES